MDSPLVPKWTEDTKLGPYMIWMRRTKPGEVEFFASRLKDKKHGNVFKKLFSDYNKLVEALHYLEGDQ